MSTTTLKYRSALGPASAARTLGQLARAVATWRKRARQRRDLAEMSPEMLRDIGISRSAARAEASKPFWIA